MSAVVLVASWQDGLFALTTEMRQHELAGRSVRGLAPDGRGGVLAIVDGTSVLRRSARGEWSPFVRVDCDLSCCVAAHDAVYLGTDTARVVRVDRNQTVAPLAGFDSVSGRETWTAGQALVDGKLMGPPLGVRSISAAADGTLLANVHVGGIPRSTDGGTSWHPTLDVQLDVHEVRAHSTRSEIAVAAAAFGLCLSRDGGATWAVQHEGLHVPYCSAVACVEEDVWVSASDGPFAAEGRIYRRRIDDDGPLTPVPGLPEWTDGKVDTHCIGVNGRSVAFADDGGNVYVSGDAGLSWSYLPYRVPGPSSVLVS